MAHTFTDEELQQVIGYIALRYLEVERGLRPPDALRGLMTHTAYDRLRTTPPIEQPARGPVRQTDLGRFVYQRPRPDRVFVTMPARTHGDEWSALVMQLRANTKGVWRVTELARLDERTITTPRRTPAASHEHPDVALARNTRDLEAARLALLAVTERHDHATRQLLDAAPRHPAARVQVGDLINTGGPAAHWSLIEQLRRTDTQIHVRTASGHQAALDPNEPVPVAPLTNAAGSYTFSPLAKRLGDLADEQRTWQHQVAMLEHERADLTRGREPAQGPGTLGRNDPPGYMLRLLGRAPREATALEAWQQAAELVEDYRQRWGITTDEIALGPAPHDRDQAHDRDQTIATLRVITAHTRPQAVTLEAEPLEHPDPRMDRSAGR